MESATLSVQEIQKALGLMTNEEAKVEVDGGDKPQENHLFRISRR